MAETVKVVEAEQAPEAVESIATAGLEEIDPISFERAVQVVLSESSDSFSTRKISCVSRAESALIALLIDENKGEVGKVLLGILDDRIENSEGSLLEYKAKRDAGQTVKKERDDTGFTEFQVMRLDLLPGVIKHLKYIRICLALVLEDKGEIDELVLRAVRRVQAAVVDKGLKISYKKEQPKLERRVMGISQSDGGVLTYKAAMKLLVEYYAQECAWRCLNKEQMKALFAEKLAGIEVDLDAIYDSVVSRVAMYFKEKSRRIGDRMDNPAPLDIDTLQGLPLVTRVQRDSIKNRYYQSTRVKPQKYRRNLFWMYLNLLSALPDLEKTGIPWWDKDRRIEIQPPCKKMLRTWGAVPKKEPSAVAQAFTTGVMDTLCERGINHAYIGARIEGCSERKKFDRERKRLMLLCGSLLADLHEEDMYKELVAYCSHEGIDLMEAVKRFTKVPRGF